MNYWHLTKRMNCWKVGLEIHVFQTPGMVWVVSPIVGRLSSPVCKFPSFKICQLIYGKHDLRLTPCYSISNIFIFGCMSTFRYFLERFIINVDLVVFNITLSSRDLSSSKLRGPIPPGITDLAELKILYGSHCCLLSSCPCFFDKYL